MMASNPSGLGSALSKHVWRRWSGCFTTTKPWRALRREPRVDRAFHRHGPSLLIPMPLGKWLVSGELRPRRQRNGCRSSTCALDSSWKACRLSFLRHAVHLLMAGDAEAADRDEATDERAKAWALAQESLGSLGRNDRDLDSDLFRRLWGKERISRNACSTCRNG